MTAWTAISDFINILKSIPESVIPADHIGIKRPGNRRDLPAIVITIGKIEETPIGIGGVVETKEVSDDQWIETRGKKISGILTLEIWASNENEMNKVAEALFQTIEASKEMIREKGFTKFGNYEIGPTEEITLGRLGTTRALRMMIKYLIVYEEIKTETIGPHGIIRHIHVDIDYQFDEKMDLR